MTVYMLRNNVTGLYYRRTKGSYSPSVWVPQEKASIWTVKIGPASSKSRLEDQYRNRRPLQDLEIVSFTITEITP